MQFKNCLGPLVGFKSKMYRKKVERCSNLNNQGEKKHDWQLLTILEGMQKVCWLWWSCILRQTDCQLFIFTTHGLTTTRHQKTCLCAFNITMIWQCWAKGKTGDTDVLDAKLKPKPVRMCTANGSIFFVHIFIYLSGCYNVRLTQQI